MFKKLLCFIVGHNISTSECPVTGAKKTTCLRCTPIKHQRDMSFN